MSATSHIYEDDSLYSRCDRYLFKLESVFNLIGGFIIFAIVLLAVINILGRKFLNTPVDGYIDWIEQSMTFFAFLGIAYCQRLGGHIRMDIFVRFLKGRALWLFELVSTLLMWIVTVVLTYGSYLHFERAYINGDSSFDIDLPTWPAKLVVPVMLALLSLRLSLHIWGYAQALISNPEKPIGVPMIESAAEQASKEAEALIGEDEAQKS
ncbi:MAG: TRAP transporter small permease [Pseudomonadota bacterium]